MKSINIFIEKSFSIFESIQNVESKQAPKKIELKN